MNTLDLFPLKVATGNRFCNRKKELETLAYNITICKHTVLISPRRYGKSSLAQKAITDAKVDYALIDLFVAYDDKLVCERIVSGISQLISRVMPFSKKALQVVEDCFKNARAIIKTGKIELEISFSKPKFNPVSEILEILEGLDKFARQQKKKVAVFFDEFQDLAQADNSKAIQGAIRSVAQNTSNIAFIFSGSSRNMLNKMFDDKTQPLYMLCKKIFLERIGADHYREYIQSAADISWGIKVKDELVDRVLALTERHSFYINMLCSELWAKKEIPNTVGNIEEAWSQCLHEESRRIETELAALSPNQIKLLRTIAHSTDATIAPMGFKFLDEADIPLGSVQRALNYLLKHDYIYKTTNGGIQIVDPLIKKALVDGLQ